MRCACGSHGFVGLTQGQVALFDAGDLGSVAQANWSLLRGRGAPYARGRHGGRQVLMHRHLTAAPRDKIVDHANHDTLDNRTANLRVADQSSNCGNAKAIAKTSRMKGVHRVGNRWGSQICRRGVRKNLGTFATEDEASAAYAIAARQAFGEFAFGQSE
jgi:hypothetical protein